MSIRPWLGAHLRRWADRIDYEGAPRILSYSFTFEDYEGIRFRDDGRGCRLAYLHGDANYNRAHDESDTATKRRAEWDAMPDETKVILRKHGLTAP